MRRLKAVLTTACVAASVWIVVAPSPAGACDRQPCYTVCKVNKPTVDESGTITLPNRPIDCYY